MCEIFKQFIFDFDKRNFITLFSSVYVGYLMNDLSY